tara:strand:+ start:125 stop:424 length:300 start_codon:yes stop_codon:yes gene_type:complete
MSLDQNLGKILIIDFGSQFTQLIARRVRELGVFSEIISHKKIRLKDINNTVKGIVLSGGPLNVYQITSTHLIKKFYKMIHRFSEYVLVIKFYQNLMVER